jgi:hypothetical protein
LLGKHTGDDNDDAFDQSTRKHFDSMQECTAKGLSVSMGIVGGMSLAISVRNILTEARLLLSDAQVVCVLIMGSIAVIQQVLPTVLSSKMLGVLCVVMILNTSIFVATAHRWGAPRRRGRNSLQQNGVALLYASEELRADHEIALAAVPLNGTALQYASEELRAD